MFPGSVIRKLAHSEEVFATNETYFGLTIKVSGDVDIDAMSDAFDALLQVHPIFAGHLEKAGDGRHQIVAEDLMHAGLWLVTDRTSESAIAGMRLDQGQSLLNLRLKVGSEQTELTLYAHHSLADGHHVFGLFEELLSLYTDVVTNGDTGPVTAQPAPEPLESLLEQRGVTKQQRSGLERLHPAAFRYDLSGVQRPHIVTNPDVIQPIPVAQLRLTEQETTDLVELGRDNQVSLNSLVAAAILLAEWEIRNTPHLPIPYFYPVDLRYHLTPPVGATESTLPLGLASYLAEIEPDTELVDLARGIQDAFRADLSEGLIQQSSLHFRLQYEGSLPGLPPFVMCTDVGWIPDMRTPPGIKVVDVGGEFYFAPRAPIDLYTCVTFAGRLLVEHHSNLPGVEKPLEAIHSRLCEAATEDSWVME
ncbi:phthiocerol/phthiodiolone dimycocerosyl transferase family protein [Mycobacterium shigaense]|uniref:Phthiocerol/phthiodiolone dimycocerosyl transferase n=1 Tax=Mycobacterium shigaense TaxID=722731 RepID=A0A1Z4EFN1_9MYCO|nr:acyltransferase [Mycobacterium shigaense]MEA1124390.1 acyltransferase [Mycobacterium shigaense]PRI16500.1 acyltransferase [Mycobacterium shigaense]BAX91777.1 phthiocerol/phthiodiolone dimycocerosyl transferase [Mycobacterium shigaense]